MCVGAVCELIYKRPSGRKLKVPSAAKKAMRKIVHCGLNIMKQVNASLSDMLNFQLFMWKGRQQLANNFPRVISPYSERHMMERMNFCLSPVKSCNKRALPASVQHDAMEVHQA